MARLPIMPVATDALVADTQHLSTEQFGAYMLVLLATWRNNGIALPDDDTRMANICRVRLKRWRTSLRPVLAEFFDINGTGWHQKRLEAEYLKTEQVSELRRSQVSEARKVRQQIRQQNKRQLSFQTVSRREATLPKKDSEPVSDSESGAARKGEKNQAMNPEGASCARLGCLPEPRLPPKSRTPVRNGLAGVHVGVHDAYTSMASATDYRGSDHQGQDQDSLAERVASIGAALPGLCRRTAKSPALKAKIRDQLVQKHARFLVDRRRPEELARYWASQLGDDPAEAQRVFDDVDRRMRRAGWDDMREWKHQHGIAA